MLVRELMTSSSLATATLDTTLEEIASMMKAEDVGAIPVLDEDDRLAGIITDRDIVVRAIAEGEDATECTAEEILSETLYTIGPDATLEDAAALMSRHQVRRLPVLEDDRVIGIISLGDISVKSSQDDAAIALQEISEGVRTSDSGARRSRDAGLPAKSAGDQVAGEEAAYQRNQPASGAADATPQMGGSRAPNRNWQDARAINHGAGRQWPMTS